jgi:haloalkane dehalogenase
MNEVDEPPRAGVLRTPESHFAGIPDFPYEPRYAMVEPGLRMAYYEAGPSNARETLLLLHGEPTWGYLYRKMIPTFVAAGHRVIVPDLIGFGRSDKPIAQTAYTYSAHIGWVSQLIAHLDLHHVTFFGQDWGGLIGARVVAENASRFARVVFSNTALPGSGPSIPGLVAQQALSGEALQTLFGMDWRATVAPDDRIDAAKVHALAVPGPALYFLAWRVYSQAVEALWPSKVVPGWCLSPLSSAARAAYDAPFPSQAYVAGARRFPMLVPITADDPERLRNDAAWRVFESWNKPLLTLWGDHCPHSRHDMGRSFQQRIPGARMPGIEHRIYRASHFIQEDMGEALAAEIAGFVKRFPVPNG